MEEQIKYSSYTPAQKKASQVYRIKNKDKINEQRKKYYQARKESDPAFLEYKRKKAKEYYIKKKLDKATGIVADDLKIDVEELKALLIEEDKRDPIIVLPDPVITNDEHVPVVPETDVEEVKVEKPERKAKALVVDTSKLEVKDQVIPGVVVEPSKTNKRKTKK